MESKKTRQHMLAFAFLADLESSKKISSQANAESTAAARIKKFLKCDACTQELGHWELSVKPIIYAKLPEGASEGMLSLNTTVILHNADKTELIIGVAGTNFISTYDWFVEDLETSTQIDWDSNIIHYNTGSYVPPVDPTNGKVSKSTAIALSNTWNIKNSDQKTFIELLQECLPGSGSVSITVTGHSLGGAISPALAQALHDNKSTWNTNNLELEINTFIFAGPTAGDLDWVKYVTKKLSHVSSTYNSHDLVPHAWQIDMIEKMRTLFSPNLSPTNTSHYGKVANELINWILHKSNQAPSKYERWDKVPFHFFEEVKFKGKLPCAAKYSDVMIEAEFLKGLIEADWNISTHEDSLNALCKVCDIDTSGLSNKQKIEAVDPYLLYFCQFIAILGEEHIQAYHTWMDNAFLTCSMKHYLNMGSSLFALKGIGVIYKLFIALAAFKS